MYSCKMMDLMKNAISTIQEDEVAFVYNTFRDEFSFFNKEEMTYVIQQWKTDFSILTSKLPLFLSSSHIGQFQETCDLFS